MNNFVKIVTPYFWGDDKAYARWAGILILLLSQCMTAYAYFFIQWNRRFYDALEAHNGRLFFKESLVFIALALSFGLLASSTKYFSQQYAIRWRMWMTKQALGFWLSAPNRGTVEGSDQRIQEDLMRFTAIFERFFLDLFNAALLIVLFIPLLYVQTQNLYLYEMKLNWFMMGTVIIYTILGVYISAKIANPLINYEYNNQKLEAEFRYNLVHARDGSNIQLSFFDTIICNLTTNYNLLYNRQKYFNVWQKFYDQISILIPFALLASNYFSGLLTLGMLMQIKSTFSRLRNSMAYILDHYTEITELIAISRRLVEFYATAEIISDIQTDHSATTSTTAQALRL